MAEEINHSPRGTVAPNPPIAAALLDTTPAATVAAPKVTATQSRGAGQLMASMVTGIRSAIANLKLRWLENTEARLLENGEFRILE